MARSERRQKSVRYTSKAGDAPGIAAMPLTCAVPVTPPREFGPEITNDRGALIIRTGNKWVAGTVLHYYFFRSPARWRGSDAQQGRVREAFAEWTSHDLGIVFEEVTSADEAEVRIGFVRNDGHWSYLGRDVLRYGPDERTMNLDAGDAWDIDTAVHEIGHTLGFPHEHQNPNSGIEWNEEAVYAALALPPNGWSRETTFYNIIRKLDPREVQGSDWDRDSIMHYPFAPGLIVRPEEFVDAPLIPAPGLSAGDIAEARFFYPPPIPSGPPKLVPFRSQQLKLRPGEQADFRFVPDATRRYRFQTFGSSDSVLVLFESVDGEQRFRAGDDDSGEDRNARVEEKLFAGREYTVRLRLYWAFATGEFSVMVW